MNKYYITFGQIHTHSVNGKTIDKDCVVEIESFNHEDARHKGFTLFGNRFCFCMDSMPDMKFYPRGIIKI